MTLIINYFSHAKYCNVPINTQLISRQEKVCIFVITIIGQFSVKVKLMVLIRTA